MRKFTILLCIALMQIQGVLAQTKADKIDELLNAYFLQLKFSGTALVIQNGKEVLHKGYGYKNWETKDNNNEKSLYLSGSTTELVTAATILKLAEEGKLSLKAPVSKYIDSLPNGNIITVENLLMHSSGLFNYMNDPEMGYGMLVYHELDDLIKIIKNNPPQYTPGSKYEDNSSDYLLLGAIVAKVTGKTYYEAVRTMIFDKLGMKNSGFDFNMLSSWDKARGYYNIYGNRITPAPNVDSSVAYAATGMYNATTDLKALAEGLLNGQLLTDSFAKMMQTPYYGKKSIGWSVDSIYGKVAIYKQGYMTGFSTEVYTIPTDSTYIILGANDMDDNLSFIRKDILAILYNKEYELPTPNVAIELPLETRKEYQGRYEISKGYYMDVYLDADILFGQMTDQQAVRLFAKKKDHFFLTVVDSELIFHRNEKGEVVSVTMYKNGQEIEAKMWR